MGKRALKEKGRKQEGSKAGNRSGGTSKQPRRRGKRRGADPGMFPAAEAPMAEVTNNNFNINNSDTNFSMYPPPNYGHYPVVFQPYHNGQPYVNDQMMYGPPMYQGPPPPGQMPMMVPVPVVAALGRYGDSPEKGPTKGLANETYTDQAWMPCPVYLPPPRAHHLDAVTEESKP